MMRLSQNIAEILVGEKVISPDEKDICRYGLEVFFTSFSEMLSIFVLSLIFGNFLETVLFFCAFIPLRIYAGGYHADTKLRCYLISLTVYFLFTFSADAVPASLYTTVIAFSAAFGIVMVFGFAPIVHKRRSVGKKEALYYRKISRVVVVAEAAVFALTILIFKNEYYVLSMALGQLAETLSMIFAMIKNNILNFREERWSNHEKSCKSC